MRNTKIVIMEVEPDPLRHLFWQSENENEKAKKPAVAVVVSYRLVGSPRWKNPSSGCHGFGGRKLKNHQPERAQMFPVPKTSMVRED